jgi:hypothetical protein
MAVVIPDGKRFVVYETTQREHSHQGVKYAQRTHIRILELDHKVLFKWALMDKRVLNRVNDPVVKRVVAEWANVPVQKYSSVVAVANERCKQLNERNQND